MRLRFTTGGIGCGKVPRCDFALIQTSVATSGPACTLELVLRNGERLRIGDQVAATTLRMVLEVVRG